MDYKRTLWKKLIEETKEKLSKYPIEITRDAQIRNKHIEQMFDIATWTYRGSPLVTDHLMFLKISSISYSRIITILTIGSVLAFADSRKCCAMICPFA